MANGRFPGRLDKLLNEEYSFYKIRKLQRTIFSTFYNFFATKLYNFIAFRMLFQAVIMNIPNSKVRLKVESSIPLDLLLVSVAIAQNMQNVVLINGYISVT